MTLLETQQLRKDFGKLTAVYNVDWKITQGQVKAIIGPNGAGKSTFFGLITGKLRPTHGKIIFKKEDITHVPTHRRINRGIGMSFQITSVFENMTVFENVLVGVTQRLGKGWGIYKPINKYEEAYEKTSKILQLISMDKKHETLAGELSHGDKRILEIGIALSTNPELLCLDEPAAGLNPIEIRETVNLIKNLSKEQGLSIIIVEHNMSVIFGLAENITVMQEGQIIADGSPFDIKQDARVRAAYLGEE